MQHNCPSVQRADPRSHVDSHCIGHVHSVRVAEMRQGGVVSRKLVAVCCPSVPLCCKEVGSSILNDTVGDSIKEPGPRVSYNSFHTPSMCGVVIYPSQSLLRMRSSDCAPKYALRGRRSLASTAESRSRQIMSAELSYVQLKTANEARVSVSPQPSFS